MNQVFRNINIEDVTFFDLELVRNSNELDVNSKEFELYQRKIRNKETDELPSDTDTVAHYKQWAALKMGYNRIVCATVGRVVGGIVYLRSFTGDEESILKGLYSKFQSGKFISGFNILGFDTPTARVNSLRYEDLFLQIPEIFNDSLKKSWNLDKILELMDAFKGTHWANCSLDEVCYHLGIESPKEGGIDGSQVSDVYYSGPDGIRLIEQYCKRDVFAVINVFRRLQLQELYTEYVDANELSSSPQTELEQTLLQKLYNSKYFSQEMKDELKVKKITKKDLPTVKKLVLAHFLEKIDIMATNKKELKEINDARKIEVDEFFKSL